MNFHIHNYKKEGSITVFLSLVLLLILSLLFTIIEGARINTSKIIAERALTTAMDSVLADYYRPLWEEYHIFGLHIEERDGLKQERQISDTLEKYMSFTYAPNTAFPLGKEGINLYNIKSTSLQIGKRTKLSDYQGELIVHEAVEYMKYHELGEVLEKLLDKMSLLETPKKISIIYEEKQKVEEKLVDIDRGILELMELLDGVKTGKRGIETGSKGSLRVSKYFVKQICYDAITQVNVGINQENIFQVLKSLYINPSNDFNQMKKYIQNIMQLDAQLLNMQSDISNISYKISEEYEVLSTLQNSENTEDLREQIEATKDNIDKLEEKAKGLNKKLTEIKESYKSCVEFILKTKDGINLLIDELQPLIIKAIESIDGILQKVKIAYPLLDQYEVILNSEKDSVDSSIFHTLTEELKDLKKYISNDEGGHDFARMKLILEQNKIVLENAKKELNQVEHHLLKSNLNGAQNSLSAAASLLHSYQIKGLRLDYSSIVINRSDEADILGTMKDLVDSGITGLILDPKEISDKQITAYPLPSDIAALSGNEKDLLLGLSTIFKDTGLGDMNQALISIFHGFGEDTQDLSQVGDSMNMIANELLFQEYLKEHFVKFPTGEEDLKARKPSVLQYEQEYVISGYRKDQENISSVLSRIIFIRTILDFVSILGDSTRCNEAKLAASAIVGFTGLPILVSCTQTLILLLWSFAEALVDTSALITGKMVPLLKKQLVLEFTELFQLNRQFIQNKASRLIQTKEISCNYQDYLSLFLLMEKKQKLVHRAMDLIQENIGIRYEKGFEFQETLFGFDVEVKFALPIKFTAFSYVKKLTGTHDSNIYYNVKSSYSY